MWYHLSKESDGEVIVPSSENNPRKPRHWSPKRIDPTRGHEEDDTPRLCVCQTVGQCLTAIPEDGEGTLFIYEIDLPENGQNAPVSSPAKVRDRHITNEMRITDEVVEENGGRIPIRCAGHLQLEQRVVLDIKIRIHQEIYPRTTEEEQAQEVWRVTEDNEWEYRLLEIPPL